MEVGEILRRLRTKRNYTQEYVADIVGVDYTTYGKYEKGKTSIKLDQAKSLADLYQLTLDEFYNYGEPQANVLREARIPYKQKQKVSIMVELDGTENTMQRWIRMITEMNQTIKGTWS